MDILKKENSLEREIRKQHTKTLKRYLNFLFNCYRIELESDILNTDFENKYLLISRELINRKVNINKYEKTYKELSNKLYI